MKLSKPSQLFLVSTLGLLVATFLAACQLVTLFWCPMVRAMVYSGMVALMIPAVDEVTDCSATPNSRYGAALANSAATLIVLCQRS